MKKKLTLALIALMLISLISGCGSSNRSAAADTSYASTPAASTEEAVADADYGYNYIGSASDSVAYEGEVGAYQTALPEGAKLIYTANIDLQTTEFDAATDKMAELVSTLGGYFESSSVNNYSRYRSGSYTVRVPADKFEEFCSQVGQLCQVNHISRDAQNVSESYYDTQSRLTTQQTKLARLQELLSEAENMEDIITIESAISDTELYIEQLTGTLRHYDSHIGYSTVYISLDEVYRLDDIEQPAIGFGAKLASALKNGTSGAVTGMQSLILGLATNWVAVLVLVIIIVVAVVIVRRRKKARRAKADSAEQGK